VSFLERTGLYTSAFLLGFGLMGYEMLGSRYLNPYFGSGINTWAALISTVLGALMIGYFVGGELADRRPDGKVAGVITIIAAIYLALLPPLADDIILTTIALFGDGPVGAIGATIALFLVPLAMIGSFSPFAIRLLLTRTDHAGRVAGWVYGISTIGNIAGTLVTTFVLIPSLGTRNNTYVFATVIGLVGLFLLFIQHRSAKR
jgi:predicted MFS family arabinose efflux permease